MITNRIVNLARGALSQRHSTRTFFLTIVPNFQTVKLGDEDFDGFEKYIIQQSGRYNEIFQALRYRSNDESRTISPDDITFDIQTAIEYSPKNSLHTHSIITAKIPASKGEVSMSLDWADVYSIVRDIYGQQAYVNVRNINSSIENVREYIGKYGVETGQ